MNIDEAIDQAGHLVAAFESMLEGPVAREQAMKIRIVHGKAHALRKFLAARREASWGSGPDVLRQLMLEHCVNAKELAAQTGVHATTITNFLTRTRGMSAENRVTLAERFGVEPVAFL
jgi:antitoxin component HigA of HigAB toxin-antitoxin module